VVASDPIPCPAAARYCAVSNHCHDDSGISSRFSSSNVASITTAVTGALRNVRTAMEAAGYAEGQYTVLAQTYSSPVPRGGGFRYPQSGWTRQSIGGCGIWNRDADWANDTVVPIFNQTIRDAVAASGLTNVRTLEMTEALAGRRLCESSVGLLEERGAASA